MSGGLERLDATEAAARIAAGDLTSEALVGACLERIAAREPEIRAWAHIDPGQAMAEARKSDADGHGPLRGIPVGVKDIIDTADMPTAYGSAIHAGHRPARDSAVVAALRAAGAVILGKTATTEFASPVPIGVRNPHDAARSPGVSSSGSAAAVADFMVPVALGTQTGGSVIVPASYCGVFGYKASLEGLDRRGLRHLRPTLDTLGLLARSVGDVALFRAAITGGPRVPLDGDLPPPRIGLCRTGYWENAEPATVDAIETAARVLEAAGARVADADLPFPTGEVEDDFRVISTIEGARALAEEVAAHRGELNGWIREQVAFAETCDEAAYAAAKRRAAGCRERLSRLFADHDVLLTPSTEGEASADLTGVQGSTFNRLWTLMHGPCITIPAFAGEHGLPVGVQLVGAERADDRLLAIADWAARRLAGR